MTLSKKQISTILLLLGLIVGIFLTIYLVKQRQEIRPRALQGKANLLLSAGNTNPKVGDSFDVLVSLQLTDANLQVSGVDVMILYDKTKLQVTNLLPEVPSVNPNAAFTDAPIVTYNGDYPVGTDNPNDDFNFARVSLVARKTTVNLAKGTVSLAHITFKALNTGSATIKFPDDNNLLQIVGYGLGIPTAIPPTATSVPPSITPGGPSLTPTLSPSPTSPTSTPVPTLSGNMTIKGYIWVDDNSNAVFNSSPENVLSGASISFFENPGFGDLKATTTSISNNPSLNYNYIFNNVVGGQSHDYHLARPVISGYEIIPCSDVNHPNPLPATWNREYFLCISNDNVKLKHWRPTITPPPDPYDQDDDNLFNVTSTNNPIIVDMPMVLVTPTRTPSPTPP